MIDGVSYLEQNFSGILKKNFCYGISIHKNVKKQVSHTF